MADKLSFELVAPERVLASAEADMVVLPGEDGDFGVLPEHAPLVSLLRSGTIRIYQGDEIERQVFVAGGFAEVNPKGLIVLAEAAEPLDEIEPDEARQRLKDAEEDLDDAKDPEDLERERLEKHVAIALARVEAVEAG